MYIEIMFFLSEQQILTCIFYFLSIFFCNIILNDFKDYEYEEDPNAIEGLPASAADLLDKPYDDGFNCDQQDAGYGYYADTLNDCKVTSNYLWGQQKGQDLKFN